MALSLINVGAAANDGTGDSLRSAAIKANSAIVDTNAHSVVIGNDGNPLTARIKLGLAATPPVYTDRGTWATGTAYNFNDLVRESGYAYVVATPHTSGTFAADLAAGKLVLYGGITREELLDVNGAGLIGIAASTSYPANSVGAVLRALSRGSLKNLYDFGAVGDGTASDNAAIAAANAAGLPVVVPPGTFLSTATITLNVPLVFQPGGIIKVRSSVLTVAKEISADFQQIFDTADDFIASPVAAASVKIRRGRVKADWFGARRVGLIADIKTIPDSVPGLLKAWRATIGDYVASGTRWVSENALGGLELGSGFYRIATPFMLGPTVSGTPYRWTGSGVFGQGPAASFLVWTDLASTTTAAVSALYSTAELSVLRDFKITAYDPDATGDKFSAAVGSMLLVAGSDSVQLRSMWVSGAQIPIIVGGIKRNGVGLQIDSSTDIQVSDFFAEYCVHTVGVYSAQVSFSNLLTYHSLDSAIVLGNLIASYPSTQSSPTQLRISNCESRIVYNDWMKVFSSNATVQIVNPQARGLDDEFNGQRVGGAVINILPSGQLSGSISNIRAAGFAVNFLNCPASGQVGGNNGLFSVFGGTLEQFDGSNTNIGIITVMNTTSEFVVRNISVSNAADVLYAGAALRAVFEDIRLGGFTGHYDASANRQIFVQTGGTAWFERIFRTDTSPALNRLGYVQNGTTYFDHADIQGASLTIGIGAAGFAFKNTVVAF